MAHKKRTKKGKSRGVRVIANTSAVRILPAMSVGISYYSYVPVVSFEKYGIEDAVFRFREADEDNFRHFDAYAIRDAFESVSSAEEAFEFLRTTGVFCFMDESERTQREQTMLTWREFQQWQDFVRHVRTITTKEKSSWDDPWDLVEGDITTNHTLFEYDTNLNRMSIHPQFSPDSGQRPHLEGFLRVQTTLEALAATVFLDRIAGVSFGACALKDCPRLYEVTSKHKRQYCSEACAHKASVRRRRAMQANLKAKKKAKPTKRKAN